MEKPIINTSIIPLFIQHYEKYLPTAFDESMTLLEKVNKIIIHLNRIGELTSSAFEDWNTVVEWVMEDGLNQSIDAKLDEMATNGVLADIINEAIFEELNTKIDNAETTILQHTTDIATNTANIATNATSIQLLNNDVFKRGALVTNYPTLQDALNVGGLVIFPEGTYNISSTLFVPSNTHILGLGNVVLKRNAEIDAIMLNKNTGLGGYNSNTDIVVENIIFDANNINVAGNVTSLAFGHCKDVKLLKCKFIRNYSGWHDLEINACKDVLVEECSFEDYHGVSESVQLDFMYYDTQFPWFGPYDSTACENVKINKCVFRGIDRTKKAIGNHTFVAGISQKNITISNNIFEEYGYAIVLNDVKDFYITDNYMYNCIKGVFYQEKQNFSMSWYLDRNTYVNDGNWGINDDVEGRFFEGNTTAPSIGFGNLFIRGNHIVRPRTHAIGFTVTQGAIVCDNLIEFAGKSGIYAYGGKDVLISNNFITSSNQQNEVTRADIQVGNNDASSALYINVQGNNVATVNVGTNITSCFVTGNFIKTALTQNGGVTAKNNIIAGAYVA